MTLKLDLTPEQERLLQIRAATHGQTADQYALHLLSEVLTSSAPVMEANPFYETATPEEWFAALQNWAGSHDPNGPVLRDDRREFIYKV